jgi:basic amino acid/polyamine antiporter, APA family
MADTHKKQKIGLWTSTSLVIGNMIGAGVFLMPAAMASFGSISLLGWAFAAIGSFFLAKVFSNLSKLLPGIDGGPYVYTRHGLGDFAGFLIAWGYYISNAAGLAAMLVSFISAMTTFFPILATNPVVAVLVSFFIIGILSYINCLGILVGGRVQLITTILKLVPLILIGVGGLFFIKAQNFTPFNSGGTSVFSVINTTAAMAMFSFIGLECATVPAGEVRDSGNTVAKATMIGIAVSTIVYLVCSVSIMGMIPAKILAHSPTPFADAADVMVGHNARYWVSAGVAIAGFGAINGWILLQGHLGYGVAKDKLFPQIFAKINKKDVPYASIVINGIVVCLIAVMNFSKGLVDQFKTIMLLSVLTTVIPYLFSAAAYPIIRAKKMATGSAVTIVLAILAFAYSLWAIAGTGQDSVYYGFIVLMLGIPFYIWITYKKAKSSS